MQSPKFLSTLYRKLSPKRPDLHPSSLFPSSSFHSSPDINSCSDSDSELLRLFNYFDENGDGKISAAELQSCVSSSGGQLSIQDAETAVSSSDTDGDGLLGFQDFQSLMEGSNSEDEKKEDLRQAFCMYETEPGSGFISADSLKRMLARLGDSSSLADCKKMIRSFDINGDGLLNFHEFSLMMR